MERKLSDKEDAVLGEDGKDLELKDYITMNEKAIHGRATVLQCRKKNFLKVLMLGYQMVRQTQQAEAIKERIALRGAIAQEVNLDVQIFKPKVKQNLLEIITTGRKTTEFGGAPHPVIIVPALMVPGNLALSNVKSFLENGIYDESMTVTNTDAIMNAQGQQVVQITRRIGNKSVTFDVYDSVQNFTESRW